ncbi:hypothetical protein DFH09DRAFT_1353868 [Mycena vulgaris]|nr:hypothetical protein DFH09DRAFT_1353868 [Mycena vulgaris]
MHTHSSLATSHPVDNPSASVSHLLTQASSYPCSAATPAFRRLAQSTSTFQLALDALLPVLELRTPCELTDRILVSFILFSMYAPHPISINPFKSVLFSTFVAEREKALATNGDVAPNEPLVWVLWKILKDDGEDIGPYSPSALARSQLPPNLRAIKLILDDTLYNSNDTMSYETPARSDAHDSNALMTQEEDALAHGIRLLLAACTRVLSLAELRQLTPLLPTLAASPLLTPADLAPLTAHNPAIAHQLLTALLVQPVPTLTLYLAALALLPPTLPTFDLLGRLLRDPNSASPAAVAGVLGAFMSASIDWLEKTEREGRADDRFEQGVQHLCRFYASLIKRGVVDPARDADSAAMAQFSLQHARFGEANALYRVLALRRGER